MKCGTSALFNYLGAHPEVEIPYRKELNFFLESRNWSKGVEWYEGLWTGGTPIRLEASPLYANADDWRDAAGRMHALIPETRLILLVRDPVERVVSHYLHQYKKYHETRPLHEAITTPNLESNYYVKCSCYYDILTHYLQFFDLSQVLVIVSETMRADTQGVMKKIFRFLGIDDSFQHPIFATKVNRTKDQIRKVRGTKTLEKLRNTSALRWIPIPEFLRTAFRSATRRPLPEVKLQPRLRHDIVQTLLPDVMRFQQLTNIDISKWPNFRAASQSC